MVVWLEGSDKEKEGGIFLGSLAADGSLSPPVMIAHTTTARARGFSRIAFLRGSRPPQFVLSYTRDGQPQQVVTAVVSID